ncbi:MAG: quinohemoprotein amine dehydrogenase subunit alpha [Longimicrobiales bacterium]
MKPRRLQHLLALLLACFPLALHAQEAGESGIPVANQAVVDACERCHAQADDGTMSRISFMRKTPEGWQQSIRRMVLLNEVEVEPSVAREIVRYLSDTHGIAPDELRPGLFEVERRIIEHTYEADPDTEWTCIQCHSMGRVITQRRTAEEWELLIGMHRGYYPLSDSQIFRRSGSLRRGGPTPRDETEVDHPMDRAIRHLSEAFPLATPEWSAWSATMRAARLEGSWGLRGYDPGIGPIFGTVEISAGGAEGEFTTVARYVNPRTGQSVERTGQSLVYTGYQWRGRSSDGSAESQLREVMTVDRDWNELSGRWFTGAYDELGPDIVLTRTRGPRVLGLYPTSIRQGATQTIQIHGVELPTDLSAGDLDLGPNVTVTSVTSDGTLASAEVSVSGDARMGARDLFVGGLLAPDQVVVFSTVDRVVVTPEAGMARVGGGGSFPKGYAQFEATGFNNGPDGKPETGDDLNLGLLDVEWSLEEYAAAFGDDDINYVGVLDQNGLFHPEIDGPNPERAGARNNVGDVWAVATYTGPDGNLVKGRAHLLVTVPNYMRWEPWRVNGPVS